MRYTLLSLPLALLLGCASADLPATEAPSATKRPTTSRAFDVPALLGLNASQIVQPLNSQAIRAAHDQTPRELPAGGTEATYTYWRDTTALVVSYDPATLHVNNYFIKTKCGRTADYTKLLKLANVSQYDKRLSVEPIAAVGNPQLYTGVKLVPIR
jgi:hypothetical protein